MLKRQLIADTQIDFLSTHLCYLSVLLAVHTIKVPERSIPVERGSGASVTLGYPSLEVLENDTMCHVSTMHLCSVQAIFS